MKKAVVVVVIGFVLFLGLSSNAFCAQGGGSHGGGSHGGSSHGGSYHGSYHGGSHHYGGSHFVIGGYFGFPYYYPYGYPYYYPYGYPYSYYPYADAQPPMYSEPEQDFYWYYCQAPEGYYPYVESCPGGWTKVIPTPPESGKERTVK